MKLVSWNINGIRSVVKKGFQETFSELDADVLCLQEVRASEEQIPTDLEIPDSFFRYWNEASVKKGYSGTAIYSRIEADEVLYGLGIEEFDGEGRLIGIRVESTVILNIYFPNGTSNDKRLDFKLRYYDAYLEFANGLLKKGYDVITCGDFNTCHKEIDIARPKANEKRSGFLPIERAWMDKYVEQGYVDTFRQFHPNEPDRYSWWSNRGGARERNVGWRIDYFFVNEKAAANVTAADILDQVMGSDHCPITLEVDL